MSNQKFYTIAILILFVIFIGASVLRETLGIKNLYYVALADVVIFIGLITYKSMGGKKKKK